MKLITKEIIKLFKKYPIGSQDGKRGDATVIVKFFYPAGAATWLITEGNLIKDENRNVSDIEMFERGQILLASNSNTFTIDFIASQFETKLVTTDRKKLAQIVKEN